jgi:hypothetical protein
MTATAHLEQGLAVSGLAGPGAHEACLLGCDFSSSPTPKKQIVLAFGRLSGGVVLLQKVVRCSSLDAWQQQLQTGPWVGAFDLPFGLPRELVEAWGWPVEWASCMRQFAAQPRPALRLALKAFCDARPAGAKFVHRATDRPAGSSPSMKWVNPPVAWMLHAGLPVVMDVGAHFPAHGATGAGQAAFGHDARNGSTGTDSAHSGGAQAPVWPAAVDAARPHRVALEGYPGLLARELTRGAVSYKSDDRARQTPERLLVRKDMLTALEQGRSRLGLRLKLSAPQADTLVADASGDSLDAVLCLVQAAWSWQQHQNGHPNWGLPSGVDPLEGWIVTA